jgi:hypothetical protein
MSTELKFVCIISFSFYKMFRNRLIRSKISRRFEKSQQFTFTFILIFFRKNLYNGFHVQARRTNFPDCTKYMMQLVHKTKKRVTE